MLDFNALIDFVTDMVIDMGGISPLLIVETTVQPIFISMDHPGITPADRQQTMSRIGQSLASRPNIGKLVSLYYITEAWVVKTTDANKLEVPVSLHPDRVEVVSITGLVIGAFSRIALYEMIREGDKLRELRYYDGGEGTMIDTPLFDAFLMGWNSSGSLRQ